MVVPVNFILLTVERQVGIPHLRNKQTKNKHFCCCCFLILLKQQLCEGKAPIHPENKVTVTRNIYRPFLMEIGLVNSVFYSGHQQEDYGILSQCFKRHSTFILATQVMESHAGYILIEFSYFLWEIPQMSGSLFRRSIPNDKGPLHKHRRIFLNFCQLESLCKGKQCSHLSSFNFQEMLVF